MIDSDDQIISHLKHMQLAMIPAHEAARSAKRVPELI
jgi:hypothetical protein